MINMSAMKTGLVVWVNAVLAVKAIPMFDNGPRPDLSYLVYRFTNINPIGEDENLLPSLSDGIGKTKGNRDMPIFFQFNGANAFGNLELLYSSLANDATIIQLENTGLGYVDVISPVSDITIQLDGTRFEERSAMTLRFRTVSITNNVDYGAIEALEYDYESVNPTRIENNILIDTRS